MIIKKSLSAAGWAGAMLLLCAATAAAQSITPKQVQDKISAGGSFIIFDIRDLASFNERHIVEAIHLNWNGQEITDSYWGKIGSVSQEVILYCQNGAESKKAVAFLKSRGYTNVSYIEGGMAAYLNSLSATQNNPTTWVVIKTLFGGNYKPKSS